MTGTAQHPPFTLLLVDDHAIVREGLRRVLDPLAKEWRVLEASNGFEALDILRAQAIGLAIVDLSMPGMSGLDLMRRIREGYPHIPALMLSMYDEQQYARRAFKAGANGYVTKDTAAGELVAAVRKVLAGGVYVSMHLAESMVQELSGRMPGNPVDLLSDRELEVLRRITAGQRLMEIADALHLSIKTVSTHKSRIQDKLQRPTMAALIRFGMEHGLDQDASGFGNLKPAPAVPDGSTD